MSINYFLYNKAFFTARLFRYKTLEKFITRQSTLSYYT